MLPSSKAASNHWGGGRLTLPLLLRNLLQRGKHAGHGEGGGALQHGLVVAQSLEHVSRIPHVLVHVAARQGPQRERESWLEEMVRKEKGKKQARRCSEASCCRGHHDQGASSQAAGRGRRRRRSSLQAGLGHARGLYDGGRHDGSSHLKSNTHTQRPKHVGSRTLCHLPPDHQHHTHTHTTTPFPNPPSAPCHPHSLAQSCRWPGTPSAPAPPPGAAPAPSGSS